MYLRKDVFLKSMAVHNLGMVEISKKMGISRSYLWEVLEGKKMPGKKLLFAIPKVFPGAIIDDYLVDKT
jgi:transcriptional regulator with XRE-family HTH domain